LSILYKRAPRRVVALRHPMQNAADAISSLYRMSKFLTVVILFPDWANCPPTCC